MKKKETKPQKQKTFNKNAKKRTITKKAIKNILDEKEAFDIATSILITKDIYLLDLKVKSNKYDVHIYAVIHKKNETTTHNDCVTTTKIIKEIISEKKLDEDDYSITVSSAGFNWIFKSDLEYQIFIGENIKLKYLDDKEEKNVTLSGVLKENHENYIIIQSEEEKIINKEKIIKAKLNN